MVLRVLPEVLETICSAAAKLTGYRRREFQAEVANKYCDGSARQAESIFANIDAARERARQDPAGLRISIDGKAKVLIGPFSRRGRARGNRDPATVAGLRPFARDQRLHPGRPGDRAGVLSAVPQQIQPDRALLGALEQHWNGALLETIATALSWAGTMTWKGLRPIVRELTGTYERGVRVTGAAFRTIAARCERSATLPKWSVKIKPIPP